MNPITLKVTELKPALAGLGKIISKRSPLPVLGCVRIERTREGLLEVTGTDLDRTATARLETPDQGEPLTLLVPFEDLAYTLKSCGRQDALVLTRTEDQRAAIRFPVAGQVLEHSCESLPVEEFPAIESFRGEAVELNASLQRSIRQAIACGSDDETRLILNGAFLDVSKPEGHYVVGTDGRHLFSSNSFKLNLPESVIVPSHPFLGWKGFNEDGDWRLRTKPATKELPQILELASGHWRYVCRSHEGNYPNWRQVLPSASAVTCRIRMDAEAAEHVIQTISRLPEHDTINHTIGLEVKNGQVHLLAKANKEQPWADILVKEVKVQGSDLRTFVNRFYLTKALRFGLTEIGLIDGMSPLRLHEGGRQMIVMPVRAEPAGQPIVGTSPASAAPAPVHDPAPATAEQVKETALAQLGRSEHITSAASASVNPVEETRPALELALTQLEVVRGEFRGVLAGIGKLGDLLKQVQREQKNNDKEISSVRQTLRSLQSVRI